MIFGELPGRCTQCNNLALEVPSDLQDMEIPLEDMGDVIVLTGL